MDLILDYIMNVYAFPAAQVAGTACFVIMSSVVFMFVGLIIYQELQSKAYEKHGYLAVLRTYPKWLTPDVRQAIAIIVVGAMSSLGGVLIGAWYAKAVDVTLDSLIRWPW